MIAGIFGRERRAETTKSAPGPLNDFWYREVAEAAGISITPELALSITAVYSCVRVIAETLATLPLFVYRRLENGGKERATTHPLYDVLHHRPNQWQTRVEFIEMLAGHVALRGNGYADIAPGRRGAVNDLIPIHPDRVKVEIEASTGLPLYKIRRFPDNKEVTRLFGEVMHVRGLSSNGYQGMSPIALAREAVGLAKQTERHGASLFSNKAIPGGVLEHPDELDEEALGRLRDSLGETYTGAEGWHRPLILEEGMKWHQISLTAEDAQFLETRKFQVIEVARLFRVPPHLIQDLERATFSNVEQMALDFVMHTVRPWAVRFEQTASRDLITRPDLFFAEFLIDGLLRGDSATRSAALQTQFMNGALNVDEWREIENRNPLPDGLGRRHFVPVNLQPIDAPITTAEPAAVGTPAEQRLGLPAELVNGENGTHAADQAAGSSLITAENINRISRAVTTARQAMIDATIQDAAQRIYHAELEQTRKRAAKPANPRLWLAWLKRFSESHAKTCTRVLAAWQALGVDVEDLAAEIVTALEGRLAGLGARPEAALEIIEKERPEEIRQTISRPIQEATTRSRETRSYGP